MIVYKNIGAKTRTFHGVTFEPNEAKEVSGHINHRDMIRLPELPKVQSKSSAKKETKPAKVEAKVEEKPKVDEPKVEEKIEEQNNESSDK